MARKSQNSTFKCDIIGIVSVALGIFMILSVFSTSVSGELGSFFKKVFIFLFGIGAFVIPFLIIAIGIIYIIKKGKIGFNRKFTGIILFLINTMLFIQLINMYKYLSSNGILYDLNTMYSSQSIFHGGVFSYLIDYPLEKFLGVAGSVVLFITLYIISFILIFKLSLYDAAGTIKKNISERKSKNTNVKDKNKTSTSGNKKDFIDNISSKMNILDFMNKDNKGEIQINELESSPDIVDNGIEKKKLESQVPNEKFNEEVASEINESTSSQSPNVQYEFPSIDLLDENKKKFNKDDKKELIMNANKLEDTLQSFGVDAKVVQVTKGPSVTRFELQPSSGVKVSKIINLSDDIALNLAAPTVRIEAPIPGKAAVGIEVPNKQIVPVLLREVIQSDKFAGSNKKLSFCLGKDIGGNCIISDLTRMPHLLIAGATGSGKSVCINALIVSLLYKYSPNDVKLLLIDPKVVELSVYNGIPHLLIPVVTEPKKAAGALNWAVEEMTRRYKLFADNNVRNITSYNELFNKGIISEKLPLIVIIIDELADLMMVCAKDVEDYIGRLAQMARAAGMHLVIATQRPSVDVITGVIKANIPSRISFAVSSQIDSRTILDMSGAEKLLGKGDMLFYPLGESKPLRIQGAFISEDEVERVVTFIKSNEDKVQYKEEIIEEINNSGTTSNEKSDDQDELLNEAVRVVVDMQQASTSLLQRKLKIGYSRAARIIDQMEEKGYISQKDGSKPRKILIDKNSTDYLGNNVK